MSLASQASQVRILYRRALCLAREHSMIKSVFYDEADWIRTEFRKYMNEKDPLLISDLIRGTEYKLKLFQHPDPYLGMLKRREVQNSLLLIHLLFFLSLYNNY